MPFGGYEDFDDCVAQNQDKDDPEAYCGKIKHEVEGRRTRKAQYDQPTWSDFQYVEEHGQLPDQGMTMQELEELLGDDPEAWEEYRKSMESRKQGQGANPYTRGNPYAVTPRPPGTPDDMLDGPPRVNPVLPEYTQTEEEEEDTAMIASVIPIFCHACDRRYRVASVSEDMKCICGSDDLDLDTRQQREAMEGDAPLGRVDEGDFPMDRLDEPESVTQRVRCSTCAQEFNVEVVDPAQPLGECPNCGADTLSAGGSTIARRGRRKQAASPPLQFMLGGPYAYVYPEGHENMKLGWDLFGGEVEILREGTPSRIIARDVTNKTKFRKVAEDFFAQVFIDDETTARRSQKQAQRGPSEGRRLAIIVKDIQAENPGLTQREAVRVARDAMRLHKPGSKIGQHFTHLIANAEENS